MTQRALILLPLFACAAGAQQTPPPIKLGNVVFSGSFRSRTEMWDWWLAGANHSYGYSGNILRFGFSQNQRKYDWQVEFAAPFLLGIPDHAIAAAPQGQLGLGGTYYAANSSRRNAGMVFPKQGFLRLKGQANSIRLGRFEWMDGSEAAPKDPSLAAVKRDRINQRLIGPFGWSHVGRSFDGGHYVYNKPKFNFTLLSALPTRGAFQVDGWGQLKVGFAYASATGQVTSKNHSGEWRALGIYYHDWRKVLKTDNRPQGVRQQDMGNIRIGTFGGHYIHNAATAAGSFDLVLWGVLQTGRWGALDHSGRAGIVEAGWQPKVLKAVKPWLRAGYSHTSGDSSASDARHETFFQKLPTPRAYARFPFFNMMNNDDIMASLALRPYKSMVIRPEVHGLRLAHRNDLWYLGGGAFQPWTFGYVGRTSNGSRGLATLFDVSVDYTLDAHWAVAGYVGYADGKSVIRSIYPNGQDAKFGYLELTYRF
jgi:hypothetical protein